MRLRTALILTVLAVTVFAALTFVPIVPEGLVGSCNCNPKNPYHLCSCILVEYPAYASITYNAFRFGGYYVDGKYTVVWK